MALFFVWGDCDPGKGQDLVKITELAIVIIFKNRQGLQDIWEKVEFKDKVLLLQSFSSPCMLFHHTLFPWAFWKRVSGAPLFGSQPFHIIGNSGLLLCLRMTLFDWLHVFLRGWEPVQSPIPDVLRWRFRVEEFWVEDEELGLPGGKAVVEVCFCTREGDGKIPVTLHI